MLRYIHTLLFIMILSGYLIADAQSATSKCTDGKQITYANQPCEKLGLKPAGPIKDGVTVVPAAPKQKKISTENSNVKDSTTGSTQPNDYQVDDQDGEERSKKQTTTENASILEKLLQ